MSADRPDTPALWRGRLGGLDPRAQRLNDSLAVDGRLWPEELTLAGAYARSLEECGVMTPAERRSIDAAVESLKSDLETGRTGLAGEDVHSAVEAELSRRAGPAGEKIHTGRSRNDQVVTLFRMRVMALAGQAVAGIQDLERAVLSRAETSIETIVAAQTHLQPAQPVSLGQLWMAHLAALARDEERFQSAAESADRMPLGAGAVAGSPLKYDRLALAGRLGFSRVADNSVDAVGDRDFALDYLQAAASLGVHLSRLAEDLVLWCSPGWGWYRAPEGFSTGSSLLPQKRNPDLFELARGKAGRLIANAGRLAIVLKGLPSSYQKDLQEDKEAVFDTADTLAALLDALPPAIEALTLEAAGAGAGLSFDLLAVELADALVADGLPFRQAHHAVARLWALAEEQKVPPPALPEAERLAIHPAFTTARLAALDHASALARRNHEPGAGPAAVTAQIGRARERLGLVSIPAARPAASAAATQAPATKAADPRGAHLVVRRARPDDVPQMAALMAGLIADGTLLPRSLSDLYQSVREFHVVDDDGQVAGCAALRLLWADLGEVRTLAVASTHQGLGLGRTLVERTIEDARDIGLARVIALTREVAFFERCGFTVLQRDSLPRKVWTDCIHCPRRHACDETAVVLDLVPGATETANAETPSWVLPIPPARRPDADRSSNRMEVIER